MIPWNEKTLLVLNPVAGHGDGEKNVQTIFDQLKTKIEKLELISSRYPGHLVEIGKQAVLDGYRHFITIGGDGTPFELLNGLYAAEASLPSIRLAMIPAGTGNSFLRDFMDISRPEGIIHHILNGEIRPVDVVEFVVHNPEPEKKIFLNILGVGLIADILKLTNEKLKGFGPLGYSLAVLIRLFKGMHNEIHLQVDGKEIEIRNSALVVSNSKYTGGKMKIAPMARTDDGQVDMVIFNGVNRRDIISIFSKVFSGRHVSHEKVNVLQGREIAIQCDPPQMVMADGELLGETPLHIRVLPKKLNLVI
jgi:YegS/Rv2252/BmrU family lipid kinase